MARATKKRRQHQRGRPYTTGSKQRRASAKPQAAPPDAPTETETTKTLDSHHRKERTIHTEDRDLQRAAIMRLAEIALMPLDLEVTADQLRCIETSRKACVDLIRYLERTSQNIEQKSGEFTSPASNRVHRPHSSQTAGGGTDPPKEQEAESSGPIINLPDVFDSAGKIQQLGASRGPPKKERRGVYESVSVSSRLRS